MENIDLEKDERFKSSSDQYLSADDFADKPPMTLEISEVGGDEFMQKNRDTGEEEATWKLILSFKGKDKQIVVSWNNQKLLKKAFGPKTKGWVNKKIIVGTTYYDGIGKHGFTMMQAPSDLGEDEIPF